MSKKKFTDDERREVVGLVRAGFRGQSIDVDRATALMEKNPDEYSEIAKKIREDERRSFEF